MHRVSPTVFGTFPSLMLCTINVDLIETIVKYFFQSFFLGPGDRPTQAHTHAPKKQCSFIHIFLYAHT